MKKKTLKLVSVRMSEELHKRIKKGAKMDKQGEGQFMREILSDWFKQQDYENRS